MTGEVEKSAEITEETVHVTHELKEENIDLHSKEQLKHLQADVNVCKQT